MNNNDIKILLYCKHYPKIDNLSDFIIGECNCIGYAQKRSKTQFKVENIVFYEPRRVLYDYNISKKPIDIIKIKKNTYIFPINATTINKIKSQKILEKYVFGIGSGGEYLKRSLFEKYKN